MWLKKLTVFLNRMLYGSIFLAIIENDKRVLGLLLKQKQIKEKEVQTCYKMRNI